jgi:uncharacterized membrane protein HdeD (DUF308 family)
MQVSLALLVALFGVFSLIAARSDAQQHAGPPYYLLFEVLFILFCFLLCLAAILICVWKPAGWWLSICIDFVIALIAAYAAISDVVCKTPVPLSFDWILLAVAGSFGFIAILLASAPSRSFFGVFTPPVAQSY